MSVERQPGPFRCNLTRRTRSLYSVDRPGALIARLQGAHYLLTSTQSRYELARLEKGDSTATVHFDGSIVARGEDAQNTLERWAA